jgi:hypothetical protein
VCGLALRAIDVQRNVNRQSAIYSTPPLSGPSASNSKSAADSSRLVHGLRAVAHALSCDKRERLHPAEYVSGILKLGT